ncbi:MAG: VCBS repeat-containing protein [Planctomycetales bacterium]|nr:VCBS repeat-containing protein [Planctomycetales bacterium]
MFRQFAVRSVCCLAALIAAPLAQQNFAAADDNSGGIVLREQELSTRLTVGYAVRLIDMNKDDRLDIVIVDSKRIVWLQNPNWDEHVLIEDPSKPNDNVCFAPSDIDRDGWLDFAVGADWQFNNTKSGGTIGWISGRAGKLTDWKYHAIGEEPTVHRMQFVDLDVDGQDELIVAPLKGRNTTGPDFAESGVRLLAFPVPKDPVDGKWQPTVISDQLHVVHNFWPTNFDTDVEPELLVVSFEGVTLLDRQKDGTYKHTRIGSGEQNKGSNRGASEIKLGLLDGAQRYIATIEPWHGDEVVVYTPPKEDAAGALWNRHVLDDQLKWGHAVFCANLDNDPDEELIIGVRDDLNDQARRGLRIYDPVDASAGKWTRQVVDPGSVAIEDLQAADLNGDNRIDIVAVGRQTHNVKIYWNETK